MGYKVKVGKNARKAYGHTAGTIEERIYDFHEMLEDSGVKAIITSIGGYNSNQLLDLIDYSLVRRKRKLFCGYSDITSLHCGIHSQTGLVTFYGPQAMPQFGDSGGPIRYTLEWFQKVVSSSKPVGKVEPSKEFTYERLEWGFMDSRPKELLKAPGWKVLRGGEAAGRLMGGHLGTLQDLAGTKYFPDFNGKIFFWEETESHTAMTDRYLCHLRMLGVFDKIRGMIVGRVNPNEYEVKDKELDFHKVILEATKDYAFPILAEMDFGHTDPMLTLPYGVKARIETGRCSLSLLESAVE